MFSIVRLNVIESNARFSVEILGLTGPLYAEGERMLRIDSEILSGPSGIVVFSSSIKNWAAPHAGEPISALKKERIIENIRAAFMFRGFDIDVV